MYKNIDPFMKILPQLDVHGFIEDSYKLGRKKIVVIHGKGQGILRRKIHNDLKNNRLVKGYYLYNFNIGCTIIELN